jgi:EAL domain-containing protein (putative c-di-GMP-specific phosphodiesterase class I)
MPVDEANRRASLAKHYVSGSLSSPRLLQTLELAASAIGFARAHINIVDDTLVHSIGGGRGGVLVTPRAESMSTFTVAGDEVLAVADLRRDPRSKFLPGVVAGEVASYLGAPLHSRDGVVIGTLALVDSRPRVITAQHIELITQFGQIAEDQLDRVRRLGERGAAGEVNALELATAIRRSEIVPWFQPIVDMHTDRVVGYEALARWPHPQGEMRTPAAFVPLAEDSDLIVELDRAVLLGALRQLTQWQAGDSSLHLAINLSTRHLEIPDGVTFVRDAVRDAGIAPSTISLELTETRYLSDPDSARDAVAQLRGHGYHVVLDDFGTGWSSLDWVLALPINGIKIDRAVTTALGTPSGDAVARALAGLARDLDLSVIVEGINNRTQIDTAKALGFRHGQGYYWTPPRPGRWPPPPTP